MLGSKANTILNPSDFLYNDVTAKIKAADTYNYLNMFKKA